MKNILLSEIYKLKRCWTIKISLIVVFVFPLIGLALTFVSEHAILSKEPQFLLFIRQNHIFFSMFIANLLFPLISAHLFFKEFQFNTLADIITVPVKRTQLLFAKEIILFLWVIGLGLISFLFTVALGLIFQLEGLSIEILQMGGWRFLISAVIAFIPLQIFIWITIMTRNYFTALAVSIVAMVGVIVAYNTKDIIFVYPFSINFVLTNFVEKITLPQLQSSMMVLALVALIFIPATFLRFQKMDI